MDLIRWNGQVSVPMKSKVIRWPLTAFGKVVRIIGRAINACNWKKRINAMEKTIIFISIAKRHVNFANKERKDICIECEWIKKGKYNAFKYIYIWIIYWLLFTLIKHPESSSFIQKSSDSTRIIQIHPDSSRFFKHHPDTSRIIQISTESSRIIWMPPIVYIRINSTYKMMEGPIPLSYMDHAFSQKNLKDPWWFWRYSFRYYYFYLYSIIIYK